MTKNKKFVFGKKLIVVAFFSPILYFSVISDTYANGNINAEGELFKSSEKSLNYHADRGSGEEIIAHTINQTTHESGHWNITESQFYNPGNIIAILASIISAIGCLLISYKMILGK